MKTLVKVIDELSRDEEKKREIESDGRVYNIGPCEPSLFLNHPLPNVDNKSRGS